MVNNKKSPILDEETEQYLVSKELKLIVSTSYNLEKIILTQEA